MWRILGAWTAGLILAVGVATAFAQPPTPPATPLPGQPDALQRELDAVLEKLRRGQVATDHATSIAKMQDPRAIPALIGVIDSDNSHFTIYGVGSLSLEKLTGVKYSPFHDGTWWRRWWERNKERYPEQVRRLPIPDYPKTPNGLKHLPYPEDIDTTTGLIRHLETEMRRGRRTEFVSIAWEMGKLGDPAFIPTLIGVVDADPAMIRDIGGDHALGKLTGVRSSAYHDGPWWRRWWKKNKGRYPDAVQKLPIPDYPKTEEGKKHVAFPDDMDTTAGILREFDREARSGKVSKLGTSPIAREMGRQKDPVFIPYLIAAIDADNSYDTVYWLGHFLLRDLTNVEYSPAHDGAWWRRWWQENKGRYPEAVQRMPLPVYPKTENGKRYVARPENADTSSAVLRRPRPENPEQGDPSSIPGLIAMIDADNSYDTIYGIGYFKLGKLTGVEYSPFHDGAWWRRWWEKNRHRYPESVRNLPIPDLPKTAHGNKHVPYPDDMDTTAGMLRYLESKFRKGDLDAVGDVARELGDLGSGPGKQDVSAVIPTLIGIIDADNSYETVYGVGYYGLGRITGVKYTPYHDGAWWRRWWELNKGRYPEAVRNLPIPEFPKTGHGKRHVPFPDDLDTTAGLLRQLEREIRSGRIAKLGLSKVSEELAATGDPALIPHLIGVVDADSTKDTIYSVGHFGLGRLTGVEHHESHDGKWWRDWWMENRKAYPPHVRTAEIPDYSEAFTIGRAKEKESTGKEEVPSDVADVPCEELAVPGQERMRYFLIGARKDDRPTSAGYKLVVVLPGGDGGRNFNPFIRRIYKNTLDGEGFLIAQPVAFKWTPFQQIVWPTLVKKALGQQFSTEEFVEAVVADVKGRHPVDPRHVYLLAWSSGGPAAYAVSLQKKTSVTGAYIMASVFRPEWMPPLERARKRLFFIDHSPEDKICPFDLAKKAEAELGRAGAVVKFSTYKGGHGWSGDAYGRIREGIGWLAEQSGARASVPR